MLRLIADDHRTGDRLGIPADEVPARRIAAALDRRSFLAGTAALGVAATVLGAGIRPARAAAQPRIAIIGAGISGLAAALSLQDKGLSSKVYEAGSRVGGRMYSSMAGSYWDASQVSEWGGELIDTNHKIIQALAKRFNLPLDDLAAAEPNQSTPTFYLGGGYYPYSTANSDFQPVHQAIQNDMQSFTWPVTWDSKPTAAGIALSNMSLYDWIETRVPGGHSSKFGQLLDIAYNIEYGAESGAQTALGLLGLLGYQPNPGNFRMFGISDERYHIRGGNQQLPLAIQAALPSGTIQQGWQLTALARNIDGTQTLTFTLSGGAIKTVVVDRTILAVPLGVMKNLDFSKAGFDTRKTGAFAALGMGRNCKLQLQFSNRIWTGSGPWGISNGETYADTGYQNTWDVTRAQSGAPGILVDYTGGNIAGGFNPSSPFSTATSKQVTSYAQTFLQQLEPVLPGITQQWTGKATLSAWHLNPYSYGSYSYWPTAYCQNYAGYEGVRQGNVHFAGEHCSINFQGFMEGGAEQGQRAAGEIITDLGIH
jgi:monoamine oxidase